MIEETRQMLRDIRDIPTPKRWRCFASHEKFVRWNTMLHSVRARANEVDATEPLSIASAFEMARIQADIDLLLTELYLMRTFDLNRLYVQEISRMEDAAERERNPERREKIVRTARALGVEMEEGALMSPREVEISYQLDRVGEEVV